MSSRISAAELQEVKDRCENPRCMEVMPPWMWEAIEEKRVTRSGLYYINNYILNKCKNVSPYQDGDPTIPFSKIKLFSKNSDLFTAVAFAQKYGGHGFLGTDLKTRVIESILERKPEMRDPEDATHRRQFVDPKTGRFSWNLYAAKMKGNTAYASFPEMREILRLTGTHIHVYVFRNNEYRKLHTFRNSKLVRTPFARLLRMAPGKFAVMFRTWERSIVGPGETGGSMADRLYKGPNITNANTAVRVPRGPAPSTAKNSMNWGNGGNGNGNATAKNNSRNSPNAKPSAPPLALLKTNRRGNNSNNEDYVGFFASRIRMNRPLTRPSPGSTPTSANLANLSALLR